MKIIFDIGYNKGEFTQVCFEQDPGCKVIGVEANRDLFYNAVKKENLILLNRLVSDKDGENIDFFIELAQNGISTASRDFMENSRFKKGSKYVPPNSAQWINAGQVPTITLDTMIESYGEPDIIKIDVEGYEHKVILGLNKKVGKICFECHEEEQQKLDSVIGHLIGVGYTHFGFIGYFEEGAVFEKLTFSEEGDPYLVEPDGYYQWDELKEDIDSCFRPSRRINYGMVWCK